MKILVIGSGGREHAIINKIKENSEITKIYCAPGNAGISKDAEIIDIKVTDIEALTSFAKTHSIDLTIVGPETPLALGIVDLFEKENLKIFGPSKEAARLEADKTFAKEIMLLNNIPTAFAREFNNSSEAISYLKTKNPPYVIKAVGLCAGKGVTVTDDIKVAEKAVIDALDKKVFGQEGNRVLIEDYLDGEEASVLALTDGKTIKALSPAQDHKRLLENDKGPNTGGMGAYAPASIVDKDTMDEIYNNVLYPLLYGLNKKGIVYKGVIYAGVMVTTDGVKVVEFNVRFGDPETQAVLPLLKTDLIDLIMSCINGNLNEIEIDNYNKYSCCVVGASKGYPDEYKTGKIINGLDKKFDALIFHAGTAFSGSDIITNGGRVLGITAVRDSLKEARDYCINVLTQVNFEDMHFRRDIADRELNRNRVSVIMGSDSDLEVMSECLKTLESFDIKYEVTIGSAHRTPDKVKAWAKSLSRNGVKVVICAAGLSAHLAGVVSSLTNLPVIGVPMSGGSLGGLDALLSTVNMPGGIPVATVSIGKAGAKNAAILAARIIGLMDNEVNEKLKDYVDKMKNEVIEKDKSLIKI